MIQTQMVVIVVNFLATTHAKQIHPSAAAAAAAVAARKRKLSSQNLTEAGREHTGSFLNMQLQILVKMERTNSDGPETCILQCTSEICILQCTRDK